MPTPSPEEFWKLLAASRLVADDVLASLRRDFAREASRSPHDKDNADAATTALAKWLVHRGVLTKWQGRRLLSGDSGPFFLGDYRLLDRLEAEGSGRLFRGRHEPSGRRVCVMLLDRKLCQRVDVWTEVVRRTGIAIEAAAPILSRTWALEQEQGNRFIVCEDIDGPSLDDELGRSGPLEAGKALELMLPVVSAVAELHRRGSVHGSLSLAALRREPAGSRGDEAAGRVRLFQLPLAGDPHAVPAQSPLDATERVAKLGRRASFIAPELMLPGRFADERSDVYALGCMLHALLTGVLPCWQGDAQRTLSQAAFVGPPPLGPPQVPEPVAKLVAYMVARDPAGRYQDAAEAADQLAACMGRPPVSPGLPAAVARPSPAPQASERAVPPPATTGAGPAGSGAAAGRTRAGMPKTARLQLVGLGVATALAAVALLIAWSRSGGPKVDSDDDAGDTPRVVEAVAEVSTPKKTPDGGSPDPADDTRTGETVMQSADVKPGPPKKEAATVQIVDSDELPWASPTSGRPPTVSYLPPGAQLVLLARPADVAADEEGRLFVRSLGPTVAAGIAAVESLCGCELGGIEQIQGGWRAGDDGAEAVAGWTIRFPEPSALADDEAARERAWQETAEKKLGKETVFVGKPLAFWFPRAEQGRVLVLGPTAVVEEMARSVASAKGGDAAAADLPPDLEKLVEMLDGDRHLTLFGSPHYLTNDGRGLLAGPLAALTEPLEAFFGDGVRAAALSLHFGDSFYLELDAIAPRAEPAGRLAPRLARQLEALGDTIEDAVAAMDLHPYGRKLVGRLPAMFRVVAANIRSAGEGSGVVINAYLPRHAGHNLVLASELALEQGASGAGPAATAVAATKPGGGAAASAPAHPLDKKMSLVFAKDTLERAIQMVSDEVGMPMEILGGDLQLDGITKNQSFGLEERDKPASEVLRAILAKSDARLVYVMRSRDGVESLEVTTRAAVEKRGDKLPAIFAAGGGDAKKPVEEPKR